jgi:hypothetical protein
MKETFDRSIPYSRPKRREASHRKAVPDEVRYMKEGKMSQNLCNDCNDDAIGKVLIIMAHGNDPEIIHFCQWHASLYK